MYENHYNEHYQLARSHLCWITHRHPHIPLAYFLQNFPRQNTADKLMHIFLHITRLMQSNPSNRMKTATARTRAKPRTKATASPRHRAHLRHHQQRPPHPTASPTSTSRPTSFPPLRKRSLHT